MDFQLKKEFIKDSSILSTYRVRQSILIMLDFLLITLSNLISIDIILKHYLPYKNIYGTIYSILIVYSIISLVSIYYFNGYSSLWRYAEIDEVIIIAKACIVNTVLLIGVVLLM